MTERTEQLLCIQFCIMLEHSSLETIQVIEKAKAIGNWWLAASSWPCSHSCIVFHAELFGEISNHLGNSNNPLTQQRLLPPLTSTVKLSLFMHVHSSPFSLAAKLHQSRANHSPYINNGWTFSRQTSMIRYFILFLCGFCLSFQLFIYIYIQEVCLEKVQPLLI